MPMKPLRKNLSRRWWMFKIRARQELRLFRHLITDLIAGGTDLGRVIIGLTLWMMMVMCAPRPQEDGDCEDMS